MAGPGGGPPRKSHTKSRKGCRMCKKRHIRCDENFPQCRNCTKHSARCDYMDVSKAGEEPAKGSNPPDLLTSSELQQSLDNWRLTGVSPLVELRKPELNYWKRFSTIDLRLIHHVTTMSSELYRRGYSSCTPWTPKMSNLISVALGSDFVMSALLAFSAAHLAWQTKNSDTEHLAYQHRGIALKGLHEALNSFSDQISEAVLASSMLLTWQAKDWQCWASLQQGVSTVMKAMRVWVHQSELAKFLDSQRSLARTKTPLTPSISGFPPQSPAAEDVQKLEQIITALHNLRMRLSSYPELVGHVDGVLEYVEQMQQDYPLHDPNRAFERLMHIRTIIFWLPTIVLSTDSSDLGALAMMAHVYALAIVLEPLFPACAGLYLGNMSLEPLEKVCQTMQARGAAMPHDPNFQTALSMLDTPIHIAHSYRMSRRTITSPVSATYRYSSQTAVPQAGYAQSYSLPSPQDAARHTSYTGSTVQSPSMIQPQYPLGTFQSTPASRHDSIASRSQSDPRLSIDGSLHSVSSHQSNPESSGPNMDYFASASSFPSMHGYSGVSDYPNRQQPLHRLDPTSQSSYNTMPPPNTSRSTDVAIHGYGDPSQHRARPDDHGWG